MVNCNVINPTSMDIYRLYFFHDQTSFLEGFKQSIQTHRTTLDMPSRKPDTPWTFPFHLATLCGVILSRVEESSSWITKLPQCKISGVFFPFNHFHTSACL